MVGLDVKEAVYLVSGMTVMHIDTPDAPGEFTADTKKAMPQNNLAVTDHNVLGGHI